MCEGETGETIEEREFSESEFRDSAIYFAKVRSRSRARRVMIFLSIVNPMLRERASVFEINC